MKLYPHQIEGLKATKNLNRVAIPGYTGLYEIDTHDNVYSLLQAKSRRKRIITKRIRVEIRNCTMYSFSNSARAHMERG